MAMTDRQYLAASAHRRTNSPPAEMPDSNTSTTQPSMHVGYPEMITTPYNTASPFNHNKHNDSNLLTPISGNGSPSMHQQPDLMHSYHPIGSHQQSVSPTTSNMYWNSHVDIAGTSSPGSSLPLHSTITESPFEDMQFFFSEAHNDTEDIPEPPEPYFGSYSVSTTQPEPVAAPAQNMQHSPYYLDNTQQMSHIHPSLAPSALLVKREVDMSTDIQHHNMMSYSKAPMPSHPGPSLQRSLSETSLGQGQAHCTRRVGVPSPLADPAMSNKSRQAAGSVKKIRRRNSPADDASHGQPPKALPLQGGRPRVSSHGGRARAPVQAAKARNQPKSPENSSSQGSPAEEPVQFKDDMPEAERFLFNLKLKHQDGKGQGMWEPITREYNAKYNADLDRAALQMRISRSKSKYVVWPESADQILLEAYMYAESQFYRAVHARFKDLKGHPKADFNVGNVEMRLIELGLASPSLTPIAKDPGLGLRRERKLVQRHRIATTKEETANEQPRNTTGSKSTSSKQARKGSAVTSPPKNLYSGLIANPREFPPQEKEQILDDMENRRGYDIKSESPEACTDMRF